MTLPRLSAALALTFLAACTDAPAPSAPASREGKGFFAHPSGAPESWSVTFDEFDECGDAISCAQGSIPELNLSWGGEVVSQDFSWSGCCALFAEYLWVDLENRAGTREVAADVGVWVGPEGGSYVVYLYEIEVDGHRNADSIVVQPLSGWSKVEFELRASPGVLAQALIRYPWSYPGWLYFDDLSIQRVRSDVVPPLLQYTQVRTELWPVNHKLVPAVTGISATDEVDGAVPVTVGVEAPGGSANYQIVQRDDGTQDVLLRAERLGNEGERVYRVFLSAADAAGNAAAETLRVVVPHDQRRR